MDQKERKISFSIQFTRKELDAIRQFAKILLQLNLIKRPSVSSAVRFATFYAMGDILNQLEGVRPSGRGESENR